MPHQKITNPFVEPRDPSPESIVHSATKTLVSAGCPAAVARWLAPLLARVLPPESDAETDEDASSSSPLGSISMVWTYTQMSYIGDVLGDGPLVRLEDVNRPPYRDAALLATLATLMGELWAPRIEVPNRAPGDETWAWSIGEDGAVEAARTMLAHGADFRALLMHGWPPMLVKELLGCPIDPKREREKRVCRVLVLAGAIDPELADELTAPYPPAPRDTVAVKQDGGESPAVEARPPVPSPPSEAELERVAASVFATSYDYYLSCFRSPEHRELARRIVYGTPEDLCSLTTAAEQASDGEFPGVVAAIADAAAARWANSEYGRLFDIYAGHAPMWIEQMLAFARDMRPFFDLTDARVGPQPSSAPHELRTVWMLLFRMAWDAEGEACPTKLRERMLAAANEDLSRLRPLLASADTPGDTPQAQAFVEQLDHFRRCCSLLALHGGLARMFKPVVLALRALRTPAVAHDLRDWPEFVDDPPPDPWRAIPGVLKDVFHATVEREQATDPDLDHLRSEFATFCLERLTDKLSAQERAAAAKVGAKRTNGDMKEPSPEWRYAYVRATSTLRANPGGKGHRTLHTAATLDPDERVRAAAREAEEAIRHGRRLPERVSPRRAALRAIWWLKQAHLRELGEAVDADGAQRTQEKELTRTRVVLAREVRPAPNE